MSAPEPTKAARQMFGDIAPKLAELSDEVLFDDVWERPGLSKRDRSLITCAALVALGLILWFARNGSSESVRDVLIAVIIGNTVGLIVVVMGTIAGTLNSMGWVAALIYLFGAAGSAYFVMGRSPQLSSH